MPWRRMHSTCILLKLFECERVIPGTSQRLLPRDAMLARYMLSSWVLLSVRLTVTCRYCIKTSKCRITIQHHTIALGLVFWCQNFSEIPTRSPLAGAPNRGWVSSNGDFRPIFCYISEMVKTWHYCGAILLSIELAPFLENEDEDKVTVERWWELVCALSISDISSDLEWP